MKDSGVPSHTILDRMFLDHPRSLGMTWSNHGSGAVKIGAVPIPTSTLWKAADYEYILNDSRARVIVISEALLPHLGTVLEGQGTA